MEASFGCHRNFGDSMMIKKAVHGNRAGLAPSGNRAGTGPGSSGNRAGTEWDSTKQAPSGN